MKKVIVIIVIIVLIIFIGVGVFFFLNGGVSGNGTPREENFFGSLFGGGDSGGSENVVDNDLVNDGSSDQIVESGTTTPNTILRQLTNTPTAGATFVEEDDALSVRYIDRSTGNILGINLETLERVRFSNTTILGVREGVWSNDGQSVILRYLDNSDVVRTFSGEVASTSVSVSDNETELPLKGGFLVNDLPFVSASPDRNKLLYLQFERRGVVGYSANFDGSNTDQLFVSEFSEWIPQWFSNSTVALTTKASGLFPGFLYFVDTGTGNFKKILGDVDGLTTNTNDAGSKVLYSESAEGRFTTHVFTPETNVSEQLTINTLAEKCVWSKTNESVIYCGVPVTIPNGLYPDEWYQGLRTFTDEIWRYDIEQNIGERLISQQDASRNTIDLINPVVSENDEFLIFTNKKDSTLWSLRLQ